MPLPMTLPGPIPPGSSTLTPPTPVPASFPFTVSIQVAFNDDVWAASPTWTDITKYATAVTTTMGRQHELQQVNPSTAVITLMNEPAGKSDNGGRFSPWNTASPYYHSGNGLTPGHPVRIMAVVDGVSYNVFYGYTQSWVPKYGETSSIVTLNCYDGLALLNLAMMDMSLYPAQVIADGATAYWECQESQGTEIFADSTGNGNTASLEGYGYFGFAGALKAISDLSVVFVGGYGPLAINSSGFMQTPITPPSATAVMFEGWFLTNATDQTLMSWPTGTSGGNLVGVSLVTNSTGLPCLFYGDLYDPFVMTQAVFGFSRTDDGNWHHYAVEVPVTDTSGTYTLYVDGRLAGSFSDSTYKWTGGGTEPFAAAGVWTGISSGQLGLFGGAMAHVAYYQTPLNATQINEHYQLGNAGFIAEDSGSRAATVVEDLAGVPSSLVHFDTGLVTLQGVTSSLAQTTASSYLQQVTNSERGLLYQDASGVLQFKNRHYVYTNPTSISSQVTFTYHDGGPYLLAPGIVPQIDDADLWNDMQVARQGGIVQKASDSTSITKYGRRTLQGYTSLLFYGDVDAADLASGLLFQYKNPIPRVRAITLNSMTNGGSSMPYMLGLNLLDRMTIVWKPVDGSSVDFSQQSLLEQITHTITPPAQWTTTFSVTPIGTEQFLIVGSATEGLVGTGLVGF